MGLINAWQCAYCVYMYRILYTSSLQLFTKQRVRKTRFTASLTTTTAQRIRGIVLRLWNITQSFLARVFGLTGKQMIFFHSIPNTSIKKKKKITIVSRVVYTLYMHTESISKILFIVIPCSKRLYIYIYIYMIRVDGLTSTIRIWN